MMGDTQPTTMNEEWFIYTNGEKSGPMPFDQLKSRLQSADAGSGETLVWSESTVEWVAPSKVPGLLDDAGAAAATPTSAPPVAASTPIAPAAASGEPQGSGPLNPYAAPQSQIQAPGATPGEVGNHQLDLGRAITQAWDACTLHVGPVIAVGLIYMVGAMAASLPMQFAAPMLQNDPSNPMVWVLVAVLYILNILVSTFLGVGIIKFMLNLVRGNGANIGDLFGGGPYLLRMLGGGFLAFGAIMAAFVPVGVVAGLLGEQGPAIAAVLIGVLTIALIYFMTRLFWFGYPIVDRGAGPIQGFKDSWNMTRGNFWRIILVYLVGMAAYMAGMLVFCVGIFFTLPLFFAILTASYLIMSYGEESLPQLKN